MPLPRTVDARLTLPSWRRVRRKSEFETAYAQGWRLGDGFFGVIVRPNGAAGARLGLAIGTKVAGNSVERNRIRRVIRESFRVRQLDLPAVDLIVSARARVRAARNPELRASLESLWDKVKEQCAAPPPS